VHGQVAARYGDRQGRVAHRASIALKVPERASAWGAGDVPAALHGLVRDPDLPRGGRSVLRITLTANNLSSIFVLDQDQALDVYVGVLGLEVSGAMMVGPMRWLTVRVPRDGKGILLELPGPPSQDRATAEQVRARVTKGAGGGGWPSPPTTCSDARAPRRARRPDHPTADGLAVRP
jgi:hypothetical protein